MKIKCYKSNETLRYKESALELSENGNVEMRLIKVYPNETRQSVIGFGGAFTEAASYVLSQMSGENRDKVMDAYFGNSGNQYNFCRTHIQSCDFALGNYAYIEDKTDTELKNFSIDRDKKYLIPMIQEAFSRNPEIKLLASPWSPPGFMKSNGEMNHGGVLKKEYYQMWADMMAQYVLEYKKLGVPIYCVTVQNEPKAVQKWDSCIYTGVEEGVFVAEYLRKSLDAKGCSYVKIAIWDHNKDCILERAEETFSVPGALESVDGIAFHWYTGDHFEALAAVREKYPEKSLVFTEGCVEYSHFEKGRQIENAEMYLHEIIGNFNNGANAYIDWNLLLDEKGGPNHVSNYCEAPVMYQSASGQVDYSLSYYYIGHVSRFVKEGAKRILVSRCTDRLETLGFVNPDGGKVLVLMNRTGGDESIQIMESGRVCPITLEAHSVVTLCW